METEKYIEVRAVNVLRAEIDVIEQTYGVKLVPDSEFITLLALDDILRKYRREHDFKEPDLVTIAEHPEFYYKHMVINMNILGMELPGSTNKPAWFRFRKGF